MVQNAFRRSTISFYNLDGTYSAETMYTLGDNSYYFSYLPWPILPQTPLC